MSGTVNKTILLVGKRARVSLQSAGDEGVYVYTQQLRSGGEYDAHLPTQKNVQSLSLAAVCVLLAS